MLNDHLTFYDILDLTSDATAQDIREAYIRSKSTYTRDSVALYSLISPEEREDTLKKIEEAYNILSDPEKRRKYDQNFGSLSSTENPFAANRASSLPQNVISIDRVPPMENMDDGDDFLIPPTTDFASEAAAKTEQNSISSISSEIGSGKLTSSTDRIPEIPHEVVSTKARSAPVEIPTKSYRFLKESRPTLPELNSDLLDSIEKETEWKGIFLRKIRDAYKISIEEMAGITKVTKTYLLAIEEENYSKLPAAVYVRGFVIQLAKVLKLPHDKVASAYLSRYYRSRTE